MGGSETDPGIFINWSLRLGTTASRCITFNKFWPISRDLVFDIRIIELWVVNEVFMKKGPASKRDFYSTVVMWNRIGRNKAKKDPRRPDRRDCFHGVNPSTNDKHCSQDEIHETDERHFEPSNPCLVGDVNMDDELLIAIKNRLAGVPPFPGALCLKREAKHMINRELPMTSTKPAYLEDRQSDMPKKAPTQVSTQVDDTMIIELKNRGTSTSQVRVSSRCTQSGIGLASHMAELAQSRQSVSRLQQVEGGYRRATGLEQNTPLNRSPSRARHPDTQCQRTFQPRRNSFPCHIKQNTSLTVDHTNTQEYYLHPLPGDNIARSSIPSDRNSLNLPEVPDFYGISTQQPAVSRSARSSIDETPYTQQVQELSWTDRRNAVGILPFQQQFVRAGADRGDKYEDSNPRQSSQTRRISRDESRDVNQEQSQTDPGPYQGYPSARRSIQSHQDQERQLSSRNTREVDALRDPPYQRNSQFSNRSSPNRNLREVDNMREGSIREHSPTKVTLDPTLGNSHDQPPIEPQLPPPEGQTVLTMTTQQVESSQLCKCGSKELNLVCGCKKSLIQEVEIQKVEGNFRECRCTRRRDCDEESNRQKKKKDKICKTSKESKAEEKRRKKELKEREKKEKACQKAKEKEERKRSKSKGEKKSKNKKNNNKDCKMCSCCKCYGTDEGEITIIQSQVSYSEEKIKKKTKKEKKTKEKKTIKEKPKKPNDPTFTSCQCPPVMRTDLNESSQLNQVKIQEQTQVVEGESSALGFCNHPDFSCPALGNRDLSQVIVQNRKSVMITPTDTNNCGDPLCTNAKLTNLYNRHCESPITRSCSCDGAKVFRNCCEKTSGGCSSNVCSYVTNTALVEPYVHPASSHVRGNSPTKQFRTSQSSTQTRPNPVRCRTITAAPAIFANEIGHGDTSEAIPQSTIPPGFPTNNVLIDFSKRGRENDTNKRYVPPCVLYLDCTKVKDLCLIIKDKFEDP